MPHLGREDFFAGMAKVLFALSLLLAVGTVCIYGFNRMGLGDAEAHSDARALAGQVRHLASEVEYLSQQERMLRSELALLTGDDGVLPKLIERLKQQRDVNTANSAAIRQLYSAGMTNGGALPTSHFATQVQTPASDGPLRVQVTPVRTDPPEIEINKPGEEADRVVVTPTETARKGG